jgi:hypothetical protein
MISAFHFYLFFTIFLTKGSFAQTSAAENYWQKTYSLLASSPGKIPQDLKNKLLLAENEDEQLLLILTAVNSLPAFYNVTLKRLFAPLAVQENDPLLPLNDLVATLIGVTRDDIPFNRIMFDDILYSFRGIRLTNENLGQYNLTLTTLGEMARRDANSEYGGKYAALVRADEVGRDIITRGHYSFIPSLRRLIPRHHQGNNWHFEKAEEFRLDMSQKQVLQRVSQEGLYYSDRRAIAGIFSTRQFAKSYYYAGTNRAPFAYTMSKFLCTPLESIHDTAATDIYVRRDISRVPGGLARSYKTSCVGCHSGMDAMSGAFSYYDFVEDKSLYTHGVVRDKVNKNINFHNGHIVTNDRWINTWATGANAGLGWGSSEEGFGVQSLGKMFSESKMFSQCFAKRSIMSLCQVPEDKFFQIVARKDVEDLGSFFQQEDYNLKKLLVKVALFCSAKKGGRE